MIRLVSLIAILLTLADAVYADFTLYAADVIANNSFWSYEDEALGAPEFDCNTGAVPPPYAVHTDPTSPNRSLQVIAWDPFTLPVSEIITGVYFNAVGRYSDPSDSCTFRVQSNGSIPQRESITEIWNQNSVLCEYRWPGDGWQLTPPASGWTEAAVDGIIIDLWRRDVNYTGPSDDLARVDAMRLIVKTAPAPGLLQINGLWDGGNGLRYWDWAPIWDGQTATYTNFTFSNVGYSDLPISIAQPTDSRLTISPSTFTLAPGQAVWMTATFNCDGLGNLDQSGIAITNGGGQTLGFFGDCLGLPECSFDATPVDLGSMYVGDTPLTLTRTIYNTGTAALSGTVSFSNPSGAFSCPQAGQSFLLPQGDLTGFPIQIQFTPSTGGLFSCTVDPGSGCAPLVVSGTGIGPICGLTPSELAFGGVRLLEWSTLPLSMTNNGGGILAGTVTLTDPDNVFSSLQEGQTYSLARNETLEIEVQYQPSGGVTNTGSINLAAPCGPVILSGNGIDAQCGLTASSLDFGSVRILESSMLPVTITNTGGGNLTGTVTLTDPDNVFSSPQEGQPYSLGYNQSLVVQVTYAPLDAVVSNGVVNLGLPCGGVDLAGVGIGPLCSLTDTQIDMGTIWVQSPMDTTVTMRNIGGGILIGQITLDDPAGVFHCTPTDTLVALAYQESIQIQIRFDPRDLGQYGATLDFGTACGAVSLAGAGDGATIPVFDTAPLVLPDTDLGEVIQQVIPLENAGNIPIHAFIGFSDPSAVFNCTSELDSVLVPSQVAGVPGRIELIVSFTPEFTTGTYQAVLSPCADCGSKVITATATYPFTGEEPVTPGDTLVGGNASSNGDFWQVYPDPDFGGLAPESVYQIDFQGGLLTLEMTSPDQVGLAVLSDQTPDSLLAVAECINGVCTLDRHLPAGAYYLVVDGTDLEYTFEMQVSATNPKLQAAGAFRFGRNTTASVSNDTLSYWNPGDYGNFPGMGGRGPEVAYKLEMTDTLDIELTMHAGFTSTLGMALIKGSPLEGDSYVSPDSCLAIGVPVGDSLRLVRPGLLPGMYFLVLDCDSADYSFTLSAANPNLLDPPGLGIGKQIRGRSLDVGHGNFWGPGDYGDSLSVGRGNEVVYEISMTDTLDVVLRTESSNVNSLGMVLLMGQSPDSVLAAAEPQGDRWVIRRRLEPGNYLLVVDSDSIDYRYTISWVNPNLLSALPFPLDLVLPDSSGRSHGDFWGPEEGETFGPGREVAFRIEQVQDLDLVVHSEQIMHVTLLDDLAPDAVVIATDRIRVGDDWYTNYSVLDSTRVYFVVVDSDSTNFLFTIALRTTGIRQFELPSEFTLLGNYPNPFNPATSIRWTLPSEGVTRLEIFNMLGQKVEDFRFGALPAGLHLFRWDASHLASGAYVYRLHWNRQVQTDKLLLLK